MSSQPPGPPPGKGCGSSGAGPEPRAAASEGAGGGATLLDSTDPDSAFPTRPGSGTRCPGCSGSRIGFFIQGYRTESPAGLVLLPTAVGSCTTLSMSARGWVVSQAGRET